MDTNDELIKEIFALFGLAYYESEALHKGLCHLHALSTFDKSESITSPRLDEKLSTAYSSTLGTIIKETKDFLPEPIYKQLEHGLNKRNFLAHHFWFERVHLLFSEKGLAELQDELNTLVQFFNDLNNTITEYLRPIRISLGLTDEIIQQMSYEILLGLHDENQITQRKLQKQERVINAYDVKINDGLIAQIFETDDGCLWQFCDVGLGWSIFEKNVMIGQSISKSKNTYLRSSILDQLFTSPGITK